MIKFGRGDFVVEFNSDYSAFSGKWFDEAGLQVRSVSDDSGYLWSGERRK